MKRLREINVPDFFTELIIFINTDSHTIGGTPFNVNDAVYANIELIVLGLINCAFSLCSYPAFSITTHFHPPLPKKHAKKVLDA
ncbi:MAG TPA: hypothetical protein VNS32_07180 [Flavisolibacter sp.]|nr:hypothetical protein [Flavisolibacter sp.]